MCNVNGIILNNRQLMTPIYQLPASKNCGQACLASATGLSLKDINVLVGHDRPTGSKTLIRVLRRLGFTTKDQLSTGPPPSRAILKAVGRTHVKGFHWVLLWDNYLHDPYPYIKPPNPLCLKGWIDLTRPPI
jgi:hypothetical protein